MQNNNYNFIVTWISETLNHYSTSSLVVICGIILLLLAILGGLFMFLMRQTIIVMSRHIEFDQKNDLFKHYQNLDIEFFKTNATGDLMNRMSEDVSRVRMYTGPSIMYIINLIGTIGFSLFFMFKENALLSLYVISPLPILAIIIYYVNNIINKKSEIQQESLSAITTVAQESYSGIRVIKSFVQENITEKYFIKASNDYKNAATSLAKVEALYFPSITLLIGLSTLIAIYAGCKMHVQNPETITAGTIAEFVIYVNMLTFPVSAIGYTASMIQRAAASQKRLNEFFETKSELKTRDNVNAHKFFEESATLNYEFKNVSFVYPHSKIVALKNFNLTIEQGDKIFVLGKTGSGKSSLALLLQRMYDVNEGEISVNNFDIKNIRTSILRKKISYVPQDVFLFSDTIKNNILFGAENSIAEHDIVEVARIAGIHNEILSLENSYETVIGERGVTLSGGQKQRISMARAFLKNVPLYIFDDCFSAVDNITEHHIGNALNFYLENKTAIFISHRIFKNFVFDKIIVIDEGRIIEQGNHESLMQQNGFYAATYRKQLLD